MKDKKKFTIGK